MKVSAQLRVGAHTNTSGSFSRNRTVARPRHRIPGVGPPDWRISISPTSVSLSRPNPHGSIRTESAKCVFFREASDSCCTSHIVRTSFALSDQAVSGGLSGRDVCVARTGPFERPVRQVDHQAIFFAALFAQPFAFRGVASCVGLLRIVKHPTFPPATSFVAVRSELSFSRSP